MLHFTVPGTLPGLNEYVKANRTHVRAGSQMSKAAHYLCKVGILHLSGRKIDEGFFLFIWYEQNKRRDKDNISFAKKFILDSLQEMDILTNDGWQQILGFKDLFVVDKSNPRVEVYILSAEELERRGEGNLL